MGFFKKLEEKKAEEISFIHSQFCVTEDIRTIVCYFNILEVTCS